MKEHQGEGRPGWVLRPARADLLVLAGAALPLLLAFWVFGLHLAPNHDGSWLFLVTQRLLQGGRYFHDVVETNPPVINMVLMPPALFFREPGQAAYAAFIAYVCVLTGLCLLLCRPFLRVLAESADLSLGLLTVGLSLSLVLAPGMEFGQREHLAIILTLPAILVYAVPESVRPKLGPMVPYLMAVMAAFGFSIKPHLLVVPVLGAVFYLWEGRSWRIVLTGPLLTFIGTGLAIAAAMLFLFTEYVTHIVPLVIMAYGEYRSPLAKAAVLVVQGFTILAFALALLEVMAPGPVLRRTCRMLGLAAVGFGIAALLQTRGWDYHLIPVVALGCLVAVILLAFVWVRMKAGVLTRAGAFAVAAAMAIALHPLAVKTLWHVQKRPMSAYLDRPIARALTEAGQGSRVLIIGSTMSDGFPLGLLAGSGWGSRMPMRWLVPAIARLQEGDDAARRRSDYLGKLERSMLAEDLARFRPQAVAVQVGEGKSWMPEGFEFLPFYLQSDEFRDEWAHYELTASLKGWEVYRRRDQSLVR